MKLIKKQTQIMSAVTAAFLSIGIFHPTIALSKYGTVSVKVVNCTQGSIWVHTRNKGSSYRTIKSGTINRDYYNEVELPSGQYIDGYKCFKSKLSKKCKLGFKMRVDSSDANTITSLGEATYTFYTKKSFKDGATVYFYAKQHKHDLKYGASTQKKKCKGVTETKCTSSDCQATITYQDPDEI